MKQSALADDDAPQPPQSLKSSFFRLVRGLTRSEDDDPYTTASEGEESPPRADTGHLTAAICSPTGRTAETEDTQRCSPPQAEPQGWGAVLGGVPYLPGIPTLMQALSPKPSEVQETEDTAASSSHAAQQQPNTEPQEKAGFRPLATQYGSVRQDASESAQLDEFDLQLTSIPGLPLRPGNQPLPDLSEPSSLMNDDQIRALAAAVPNRHRQARWHLLYSTLRDGISMQTMLRNCRGKAPTIMVVRDMGRHVFGSFCSEAWRLSQRFYGTGETFVFQLKPQQLVWHWWWERNVREQNDFFMWGTAEALAVGGAGGYALWLDKDLSCGLSRNCTTFGNESLSSEEEFQIGSVELWWLE